MSQRLCCLVLRKGGITTRISKCLLYPEQLARPAECSPSGRGYYSTLQIRNRRSEVVGDFQNSTCKSHQNGVYGTPIPPQGQAEWGDRVLYANAQRWESTGLSPGVLAKILLGLAHARGSAPSSPPSLDPTDPAPLRGAVSLWWPACPTAAWVSVSWHGQS